MSFPFQKYLQLVVPEVWLRLTYVLVLGFDQKKRKNHTVSEPCPLRPVRVTPVLDPPYGPPFGSLCLIGAVTNPVSRVSPVSSRTLLGPPWAREERPGGKQHSPPIRVKEEFLCVFSDGVPYRCPESFTQVKRKTETVIKKIFPPMHRMFHERLYISRDITMFTTGRVTVTSPPPFRK